MNSELAKTISTSAVWLAVACSLTFSGIFKLQGDVLVILIMLGVPAIIAYAATEATKAIWRSKENPTAGAAVSALPTTNPDSK